MKKLILLVLTFIIFSCQKEKNEKLETNHNNTKVVKISNLLKTEKLQKFEFVLKIDTFFIGNEGTKIYIPKDLFENYTHGTVTFELKEFYSKETMILNGLSTITDKDELLESSGMFYINFKEEDKQLMIKKGKKYKIEVAEKPLSNSNIYYNDNDSIFKWKLSEDKMFTTIPDIVRNYNYGITSGYLKDVLKKDLKNVKKQDSIELLRLMQENSRSININVQISEWFDFNNRYDSILKDNSLTEIQKQEIIKNRENFYNINDEVYGFSASKLGWINCDRIISPDKIIDLTLSNKSDIKNSNYAFYFVYQDLNAIIQYNYYHLNDLKLKDFNIKGSIKAIVVSNSHDNIYFDVFYLNANSKTNFEINLRETTLEKLKQELISR
uniref:hypothetical protein n=1 Tax=Flavobacterium sp. TaxID=239 RepID=UPI00404ACC13